MFASPTSVVMRDGSAPSNGGEPSDVGAEPLPVAFVALGEAAIRVLASIRPVVGRPAVGKSQSA